MGVELLEFMISYDRVADALYLKLRDGRIADSIEVSEGVILDLDGKGMILGVEILNYSRSKVDIDRLIKEGVESIVKAR